MAKSKDYLINCAVSGFLSHQSLEEVRWNETLKALESIKSGKYFDEKEVNQWLESWGAENELNPPKI